MINVDSFDERDLAKAGYEANPLKDGSLSAFRVYEIPMTSLTIEACKPTGAKPRDAERSKNFFALGLLSWLYHRPIDDTERWIVAPLRQVCPSSPRRTPSRSGPATTSARPRRSSSPPTR